MSLRYQTGDDDLAAEHVQEPVERPVPPYYTYIFIISILLVFLVQFLTSHDPIFFEADRYSPVLAGFDKQLFLRDHEYWRILTGATLHSGLLHVGMNCYALYNLGRIFEMLSNRAHLAIVFLLSAVGGGILSLIVSPDGRSVGASGGIVGLLGYLAVYAFRRRQFITPEFRKNLLVNIGFVLIFGLILIGKVDNSAHIGGLVTGAFYAFMQISGDPHSDPREGGSLAEFAGLASMGIYIAACVFTMLLLFHVV